MFSGHGRHQHATLTIDMWEGIDREYLPSPYRIHTPLATEKPLASSHPPLPPSIELVSITRLTWTTRSSHRAIAISTLLRVFQSTKQCRTQSTKGGLSLGELSPRTWSPAQRSNTLSSLHSREATPTLNRTQVAVDSTHHGTRISSEGRKRSSIK